VKKVSEQARPPLAGVLECAAVCGKTKARLRRQKGKLSPFAPKTKRQNGGTQAATRNIQCDE
jgi:hypothetical protein